MDEEANGPVFTTDLRSSVCSGVRIDEFGPQAAADVLQDSAYGVARRVHLCNAYTLSLAVRDREYRRLLNESDLNFADGHYVAMVARRRGMSTMHERVYGPTLMLNTLDLGRGRGLRHYLYGATPATVSQLAAALARRLPEVTIVGVEAPPFRPLTEDEEEALLARVRAAKPDILWVGLGTPKQDRFVAEYAERLACTVVPVGAAFDFHAGTKMPPPKVAQRLGLEWLFRLMTEPIRLWRRYLIGIPIFLVGIFADRVHTWRIPHRVDATAPPVSGPNGHHGVPRQSVSPDPLAVDVDQARVLTTPGPVIGSPEKALPSRRADDTVTMSAIADETFVMRAITEPAPAPTPSLTELAARNGLALADARPSITEYSRQLWTYRHFVAAYANARLIASFNTARLGRLWQVLMPLANAAVYYLVFGVVLNTRNGVPNFVAYLCIGLFVFTFTQTVVLSGIQSISGQLGLVRALQFPRACLPLAVAMMQFQMLAVSVVVLAGIVIVTGDPVTVEWFLLVPALLLQSVFNVGLALAAARLGARVTDVRHLMPYVMRTWMYASGVFYSVQFFADHLPPAAAAMVRANPMLVYIELARGALLASPPIASPPEQLWLLGVGWALLACVCGYVYFWRGEPEYGRG